MKAFSKYLPAFFLALFFIISCGNSDDDVNFDPNTRELGFGEEVSSCLGFDENEYLISIQGKETQAPSSKVTIFFRVSDTDGIPVAGLVDEQFTIYEQGRNDNCFNEISVSEASKIVTGNPRESSNSALLVLDLSNSVLRSDNGDGLGSLKAAAQSFIEGVMPEETNKRPLLEEGKLQMGIYWFNGEDVLHELISFTDDRDALIAAVDGITESISNDASTDLYGAVIKSTNFANERINNAGFDEFAAASIIIFTDGRDQAARYTEKEALEAVNSSNTNISYFTVGLQSDELDEDILVQIGKTRNVFADDLEALEEKFNEIAAGVNAFGESFYRFEYCTPKRDGSGNNGLVIQLDHENKKGAVQTNFDANGFTGQCNLSSDNSEQQ